MPLQYRIYNWIKLLVENIDNNDYLSIDKDLSIIIE